MVLPRGIRLVTRLWYHSGPNLLAKVRHLLSLPVQPNLTHNSLNIISIFRSKGRFHFEGHKRTFFVITMYNRFLDITRLILQFQPKGRCFEITLKKRFLPICPQISIFRGKISFLRSFRNNHHLPISQ